MQLPKELTRVWQLDSCHQLGWAIGREPSVIQILKEH
jgi:hypothetical protein